MSEQFNNSGSTTREAEPLPKRKSNGADPHKKRKNDDPLPGLNIRELVEERNWTALAGLGLIGLGLLYVVADVFNLSFALWAWLMLGVGGWLVVDAWQQYTAAGQMWIGHTRNRLLGGGLIALVGLFSILHINWWGLMLLGAGGWLAYDTWKQHDLAGHVWTRHLRNRMFAAALVGLIGVFALIPAWSTWPLLIIGIGAVMLYRHGRGKTCC